MERGVCLLAAEGYERFLEWLCRLLPEWACGGMEGGGAPGGDRTPGELHRERWSGDLNAGLRGCFGHE